MIDLHCHILPGLDDGAPDVATSLAMARMFIDAGVEVVACTPHILPGLYHNRGPQIRTAIEQLRLALDQSELKLDLVCGSDAHMTPDFVAKLKSGEILALADSRYVLVEPPHHVAPARLEQFFLRSSSLVMCRFDTPRAFNLGQGSVRRHSALGPRWSLDADYRRLADR